MYSDVFNLNGVFNLYFGIFKRYILPQYKLKYDVCINVMCIIAVQRGAGYSDSSED